MTLPLQNMTGLLRGTGPSRASLEQSLRVLNWDLKLALDGLEHQPVVKQFGIILGIQNTPSMEQQLSEVA